MAKYPSNYRQASIIPLLDLAQRQARKKNKKSVSIVQKCLNAGGSVCCCSPCGRVDTSK